MKKKRIELMIEHAELFGEFKQIQNELKFISDNLTEVRMFRDNASKLEQRRSVLQFRFDQIAERIKEITSQKE